MNKPFYGIATMPKSERVKILNNINVPGPGTYDFVKERPRCELPKWSLKKKIDHGSCFEKLSSTPGPGQYKAPSEFNVLPERNITSKGEKYRHFIQKSYSHSPLNLPGSINTKSGFSFGYREALKEVEQSPGPIYHLDKTVEQERAKKIQNSRGLGLGEKNGIYKKDNQIPGPGAFETDLKSEWKSKTCESWTFGTGKKSIEIIRNHLGPGEYDPKIVAMSRSFKITGKNQQKTQALNNTGPGSYDIPDTKTKIGTRFNSTKNKKPSQQKDDNENSTISPFTYSPPRYLDKTGNEGYSLGKRLDSVIDDKIQNPGPGSYQVSKKQPQKSGGYMGRKLQQKKGECSMDNFYKYDSNIKSIARESPKFSFGQSKRYSDKENSELNFRQDFNHSQLPKSNGYSYTMGTSKRFADFKKQTGPFKQSINNYSTIGIIPNYLKKSIKKNS